MRRVFELLDELSLELRMRMMMILALSSMVYLGVLTHVGLNGLKQGFDRLMDNRTLPLVKLQQINDIYMVNVSGTLRDWQAGLLDQRDASLVLALSRILSSQLWQEYLATRRGQEVGILGNFHDWVLEVAQSKPLSFPVRDERELEQEVERRMDWIDGEMERFIQTSRIHTEQLFGQGHPLFFEIQTLNTYLSQMINQHLELARFEKYKTDRIYFMTLIIHVVLLCVALLITGTLSAKLLGSIRRLHDKLSSTVLEKTRRLNDLNRHLKERISEEIESNRKKDLLLYQQSRLASIGELIGNIAHQWRQPLGALMMLIQSFKTKYESGRLDEPFILRQVEEGMRIGGHMSETIENFRNFFKPQSDSRPFGIEEAVSNALNLCDPFIQNAGIVISHTCYSDQSAVGLSNALTQVIINLLNNAKEAIEEGRPPYKEIKILISSRHMKGRPWSHIEIIDNGGGVPDAIIERIFDPYFTTKHQGTGTGVGLYMSKQIVEKHMQGELTVKNTWCRMEDGQTYRCAMFGVHIPASLPVLENSRGEMPQSVAREKKGETCTG